MAPTPRTMPLTDVRHYVRTKQPFNYKNYTLHGELILTISNSHPLIYGVRSSRDFPVATYSKQLDLWFVANYEFRKRHGLLLGEVLAGIPNDYVPMSKLALSILNVRGESVPVLLAGMASNASVFAEFAPFFIRYLYKAMSEDKPIDTDVRQIEEALERLHGSDLREAVRLAPLYKALAEIKARFSTESGIQRPLDSTVV